MVQSLDIGCSHCSIWKVQTRNRYKNESLGYFEEWKRNVFLNKEAEKKAKRLMNKEAERTVLQIFSKLCQFRFWLFSYHILRNTSKNLKDWSLGLDWLEKKMSQSG